MVMKTAFHKRTNQMDEIQQKVEAANAEILAIVQKLQKETKVDIDAIDFIAAQHVGHNANRIEEIRIKAVVAA